MTTFQVGDRVRDLHYTRRGEGTVTGIRPNRTVGVRFDSWDEYKNETEAHSRVPTDLALVETALARQAREYREAADAIKNFEFKDDVTNPAHYNSGKIEVWDFIYDQDLGYALGNATKYITRAGKKAGNSKVKDLRKAVAFLEREIRFEETGE